MTQLALITGASRGLGAALAVALAPKYHIVAVARTTGALEELDDTIKASGGSATLAPLDIADEAAMQHLCKSIHARWGGVNLWAHTAIHAPPLSPCPHSDPKDFDKSLKFNVTATQRLITYVAPLLEAREDSHALFFDDPVIGQAFHGTYGATKAAQMALVRSWQAETTQLGPIVEVMSPPPMATALRARFHPGEDKSTLADPKEVAQAIVSELG